MGFQRRERTARMQIKWLNRAVQDLIKIREYIADNNPHAARQAAAHIRNSVDSLRQNPRMGRPGRVEGTRELIVADFPYIIPYRVKNNVIEILRVLHAVREWPKEL